MFTQEINDELDIELSKYFGNDLFIKSYYNLAKTLWDELDIILGIELRLELSHDLNNQLSNELNSLL